MFKNKTAWVTSGLLFLAAIFLLPAVGRFVTRKETLLSVRLLVVRNMRDNILTLPGHWVGDNLSIGDEERSPSGKLLARLIGVQQYEEGFNNVAILDVELLVSADPITGRYQFKQEDLLIGSTVELHLGQVLVFGQVLSIPNNGRWDDTEVIIEGYLYSQRDWLANAMTVGDVMTSGKDGEVVAKILSKQVFPANTEYRVDEGFVLGKASSKYRDVKVTFSLKVEKRNDGYVFASLQPVKINNRLDLPFDKYNLYNLQVVSFRETEASDK